MPKLAIAFDQCVSAGGISLPKVLMDLEPGTMYRDLGFLPFKKIYREEKEQEKRRTGHALALVHVCNK